MRTATKLEGFKYWEYVLIHTENLLVISHRVDLVLKGFDKAYSLKADPKTGKKWHESSTYIGAELSKFQLLDTRETCWQMSGDSCIHEAIKAAEDKLA